jgi:hypothetical protein
MRGKFRVTTLVLEHINHVVSEEAYELYPEKRRPQDSSRNAMDDMIKAGANASLVAHSMHVKGHAVRVKDIYNRKRVLRAAGKTCILSDIKLLNVFNR